MRVTFNIVIKARSRVDTTTAGLYHTIGMRSDDTTRILIRCLVVGSRDRTHIILL